MRGPFRALVRLVVAVVVIGAVVVVGVMIWRGSGPLPDREQCRVSVGGHVVGLDPDQGELASLIAGVGVRRGMPARAVSIALATAYQESKIRNIAHGDRDSVGIFQQRPSQGWGTVKQIRDPHYATNKFFDALEKVKGYERMRITEAAQKVQRSGFPEAYEDHAADARTLASALTGYSESKFSCVVHDSNDVGTRRAVVAELERTYGAARTSNRARQDFTIPVDSSAAAQRRGWSMAQFLVGHARSHHIKSVVFDGLRWDQGKNSELGWVSSKSGGPTEIFVSMG